MRFSVALVALLPACVPPQAASQAPVASSQAPVAASAAPTSAPGAPATSAPGAPAASAGAAGCIKQGVRADFLFSVCCAGLKPLMALPPPVGATCVPPPPGPAIGECWPSCGDKVCDAQRENRCNCPADCR